jgi:hypothetical protein
MKMLGVVFLTLTVDALFLIGWIAVLRGGEWMLDHLGEPVGLDGVTIHFASALFTLSTLALVGSYVISDLVQAVRRMWRR